MKRRTTETIYPPVREGPIHHERKFRMGVIEDYEPKEAHTMIYKKVSRNEMLKALEDHAKIFNDCGILEWQKDSGQYMMSIHGATVFIDRFEINDTLPSMITMFQTVRMPVLGDDKTIDIMIGAISSHDWMVEVPEEGDE